MFAATEPKPVHILSLHKVGQRAFDLSGLKPVSIRDQLLRSTAVVDALVYEKIIGKNCPLLIYGGGVAGMNAALRAADHHIEVVVIERSDRLFSTVFGSERSISVTEYDWPNPPSALPQWQKVPLMPYLPKRVRSIVGRDLIPYWLQKCWECTGKFGDRHKNFLVNVFFSHDVNDFEAGYDAHELIVGNLKYSPRLKVAGRWKGPDGPRTFRRFGALLVCMGPGPEKIAEQKDPRTDSILGKWTGFSGPDYWRDQDRMDIRDSMNYPSDISSVIISGGGDGGMQDFQRMVTGHFGCELLDQLEHASKRLRSRQILPPDSLLRHFISADDAGRRACCWALNGGGENAANWHKMYRRQINKLIDEWPQHLIKDLAYELFRPQLFHQKLKVRWIMASPNIGSGYALNRYLSLLLLALRRSLPSGQLIFEPSCFIEAIKPVHSEHKCNMAYPEACMGELHTVWINRGGQKYKRNANLIIIRHGLGEIDRPLHVLPPVLEQIVPFRLPL